MEGELSVSGDVDRTAELLKLVHDIIHSKHGTLFKRECTDLVRRVSVLTHLFEEMRDCKPLDHSSSNDDVDEDDEDDATCSSAAMIGDWWSDFIVALESAKRLLSVASQFTTSSDGAAKKIAFQFQCVTWKLEKALENLPYELFDISEEVQEQVDLVKAQLKRATTRFAPLNSNVLSRAASQPLDKEIDQLSLGERFPGRLHLENVGTIEHVFEEKMGALSIDNVLKDHTTDVLIQESERLKNSSELTEACKHKNVSRDKGDSSENKKIEEVKKSESIAIPQDFLCPISLELMKDPVIVATGQTYERSYIQRWIDSGHVTCPKTQQKLQNFTLTPNYVLRSLISEWCAKNNVEQPNTLENGKIRKSDGTFRDVSVEMAAIQALVHKLGSGSIELRRAAVAEIRSLSKRSTDNRILIAEARAIPILVKLLTSDDVLTQENAVTSVLNLSIYDNNKGLIMLAGAVPSIVQVLRAGSMEARENAAATLFSLSLADENKIVIGASGAIPALVDLLRNGSPRGKKDAATALFNLCIYHGNKGRAVRAGIIPALLDMLTDASHCMVDEALTILSVLAGNQEAKVAIVKASTLPVLIDLLRTGLPRNKENAAAILLSLCKRDPENLACISRLGAVVPLTDLSSTGTERAKRKAASLLQKLKH